MDRIDLILKNPEYISHTRAVYEAEKTRQFCGHGKDHLLSTARILWILCLENGLEIKKDIAYAAGLLHDVGRDVQYESGIPHEKAGEEIAGPILRAAGYDDEECALITKAIGLHRTKEIKDEISLAGFLYRADKLSRDCYLCRASKDCNWPPEKKNKTVEY